jgi:acetyl-CoA carboxylase carboxyl transferase subunit alpha
LGEGGSGGALALAVADQVWMMENSVYSVISPEGCSSILWKEAGRVQDAATALKITPKDLLKLGVIERIVPEVPAEASLPTLKRWLCETFAALLAVPAEERCDTRYGRFRNMGLWREE